MLDRILNELPGRACEHEQGVTTRNHGLERQVCESCGHVTIRLLDTSAPEDAQLVGTVHHPRPSFANAITAEGRHIAE
ncbi:MAG: hypothetical protein ACFCU2_08590 [Acidimicrobiia bacterium]